MSGPREKQPVAESKVSVVILNWNRKDFLLDCLEHIYRLDYPVFEVIVVDNASTDGSAAAVRDQYPDVKLVVNDQNYGAARGKNIGLQKALESDMDFVYMIDNDIIVDSTSLRELLRVTDQNPEAGIVGTKMYDYSKPDILLSAGGIIDYTQNIGRGRGGSEKDTGQYDLVEEVDYLWGGALLVKREVLEQVGLFDTGFVGYWVEDADLSVRVRKAGYKVVYCPHAKIWHKPHAAGEQFSYRKKYMATRNQVRFMKKHARFNHWIKYSFFVLGGLPFALVRDLILHRSCMGVIGKLWGFIEGVFLRETGMETRSLEL